MNRRGTYGQHIEHRENKNWKGRVGSVKTTLGKDDKIGQSDVKQHILQYSSACSHYRCTNTLAL